MNDTNHVHDKQAGKGYVYSKAFKGPQFSKAGKTAKTNHNLMP